MKNTIYLLLSITLLAACHNTPQRELKAEERESEGKKKLGMIIENAITANVETTPVPQTKMDDAADDPAVWIHPTNTQASVVYGTDKKGGLAAYNLSGQQIAYYKIGRTNNVDIRQNVIMGGDTIDLLACTNRTHHTISVALIDSTGGLSFVQNTGITARTQGEVYGFSLYHNNAGELYAFLNSKEGEIEQWKLTGNKQQIHGELVRSFSMESQTEGMVADDTRGIIYLGVEQKGIYKFQAEPYTAHKGSYILRSKPRRNKYIVGDIEGLAIYKTPNCECYLLASSQGNYSYSVFDLRGNNAYLFSFRIHDLLDKIDGVEETDGIEVVSCHLSPEFPQGMFIAQDGYNRDKDGKLLAQNFKYIDWRKINALFPNK